MQATLEGSGRRQTLTQILVVVALVLALRLPFLHQAIQGDEVTYLLGAEHAQIDPLHPTHVQYLFRGDWVDMRGHPHPPLNVWILGGLLAAFGDIREARFHAVYIAFSMIAALAMWSLARRFASRPLWATLLFVAVPVFTVNGASLESDVPLLAFWMAAIALFVAAVDRRSAALAVLSALCGAFAGLAAYQGVLLTPILAVYLWRERRDWKLGWLVALAAPAVLAVWQLSERVGGGAMPAGVLAGYLSTYGFEAMKAKAWNAGAMAVHLGWMVSPLLMWPLRKQLGAFAWAFLALALVGAAVQRAPLPWICAMCGIAVLISVVRSDFLGAWIGIFFAGALIVFFAGSARYLLPLAAPLCILVANRASNRLLLTVGLVTQLALGLLLAAENYQHWDAYRTFAATLAQETKARRVWIDADLGLRYYLEAVGGLALPKAVTPQPGDMIVSSELTRQVEVHAPTGVTASLEVRPSLPVRLLSLDGRSAYSAINHGLEPFEISRAVVDRVTASVVVEPVLSDIDPRDPKAASQLTHGVYPDGWMSAEGSVALKVPEGATRVEAGFYIPPTAPGRRVALLINGKQAAEQTFAAPGAYALIAPLPSDLATVSVGLHIDKSFQAPPDVRDLGMLVTRIAVK